MLSSILIVPLWHISYKPMNNISMKVRKVNFQVPSKLDCLLSNMQNDVGEKNGLLEGISKVVQGKVLTSFGSFIDVLSGVC